MRRTFLLMLLAIAASVLAGEDDVLSDYQRRYTKAGYNSEREDVIKALAETGKPEAAKALQWCAGVSRGQIEEARKESDKLAKKLTEAQDAWDAWYRGYVEMLAKQGRPAPKPGDPIPSTPQYTNLNKAQADVKQQEQVIIAERAHLATILEAWGTLVGKLAPDAQKAIQTEWTKGPLASKDWSARADAWEYLGHVQTPWALDMLVAASDPASHAAEADPRVLVVVIDGLAGRDPARAGAVLAARMDDPRWLVRAAAIAALELTPSKAGVDAIVKRMAKEDGRLKEDCARTLRALTGKDMPANPEMWRIWWEQNRDAWQGKPAASPQDKGPNPFKSGGASAAPADDAHRTGFFGLVIESRRVVFVIDVSGSMLDPTGGAGADAKLSKAAVMKRELKQALTGLEDGSLFNMVFFSASVHVWKPEVQKMDAKIRKEAIDYVDSVEVIGGTSTYDALEAAYALGDFGKLRKREADPTGEGRVDTIVLLSDGRPTLGRTTDPDAIRGAVREWNRARRIAIHAIAFGNDADPKFMRGLADDTGGTFLSRP